MQAVQLSRIKAGDFIKLKNNAMLVIDVDYKWNKAHVMYLSPRPPGHERFEAVPLNLLESLIKKR